MTCMIFMFLMIQLHEFFKISHQVLLKDLHQFYQYLNYFIEMNQQVNLQKANLDLVNLNLAKFEIYAIIVLKIILVFLCLTLFSFLIQNLYFKCSYYLLHYYPFEQFLKSYRRANVTNLISLQFYLALNYSIRQITLN